jgi:hypothetical protein
MRALVAAQPWLEVAYLPVSWNTSERHSDGWNKASGHRDEPDSTAMFIRTLVALPGGGLADVGVPAAAAFELCQVQAC